MTTLSHKTLTVADLSRRFGLHPKTIGRLVREGRFLAPMAFCGRLMWDAAVFEEWVRGQHASTKAAQQAAR
jgi:hypothetical protein